MMFKEYKSAEYWQKMRDTECARVSLDNFYRAVVTVSVFALFPFLYCIASILDG